MNSPREPQEGTVFPDRVAFYECLRGFYGPDRHIAIGDYLLPLFSTPEELEAYCDQIEYDGIGGKDSLLRSYRDAQKSRDPNEMKTREVSLPNHALPDRQTFFKHLMLCSGPDGCMDAGEYLLSLFSTPEELEAYCVSIRFFDEPDRERLRQRYRLAQVSRDCGHMDTPSEFPDDLPSAETFFAGLKQCDGRPDRNRAESEYLNSIFPTEEAMDTYFQDIKYYDETGKYHLSRRYKEIDLYR